MEPPILDPDDPSIPPHIKEQIKNAAEVMAAMVYHKQKKNDEWNKSEEKYKMFVEKIHIAWKGSQSLSVGDKEELVEGIKNDTYPIIEKLSKKLLMMLDIEDQISSILKDLYFMNIIIDIYRDEDMFGNSAAIGASIGMIRSISGIIKGLPFAPLIANLEQERILNAFQEFQAANADTKQIPDKGDVKRSDRNPNDN